MKLVRKTRHGSRLRRHYDRPQTPWARLLASSEADPARTDPFALSARIDAQLERVWAFANRVTRQPRATAPKIPQPRGVTPWRGWTFSPKVKRDRQEQRRQVAIGR
jgi:hypothetical protein